MKYLKLIFFTLVLMSFFILDKVNALSLYSGSIGQNQITGYDRVYNGYFINDGNLLNTNFTINYELSNINISNYDYFITHLYFNYADISDYSGITTETQPVENTEYYCSSWSQRQQTYADGTQSTYYVCEIWSPSGQSSSYSNSEQGTTVYNNKIQLQVDLLQDSNYWSVCTIQNDTNGVSTVSCPLNNNRTSITRLRIRYTNLQWVEGNRTTSIGIANVYNLYRDPVRDLITQENNNTNSIINNQNQNQEQNHQDMQDINNSINNNNVSGANNDANSFVNNQAFQDNTGLSSVITAPLSVVNSLTSTCSPIRLTLPYIDTDIDIPCIGTMLEQKVGALAQLIKVVINGFICYIIGVDLFRIVKNARNPEDDRIEVLDL